MKMGTLLITNGTLIDPKNKKNGKWDLLIENGVVKDILKSGSVGAGLKPAHKNFQVIDAKGVVVAPGFVDLHTHLREPGFEYKETIETGTASAAAGGFTSVCCMANTNPVNDQASITQYILKQAKEKGLVNVFPIGAVTKGLEGKELSLMGELKKAGCVAVSDDGKTVRNAQLMRLAMEYARSFDLPVITHAIDPDLAERGVMSEGSMSTSLGLRGIPNEAEDIIIARDIYLAQLTGARLHVAHVATREGVELVAKAKKKGLSITCEVTPHHFTLTDDAVSGYDTNTKMAPPLRSEEDRRALIEGLRDGTIDAIATDHAPHALIDKEVEYDCACFGIVGLETALALSLKLVESKKLKIEDVISLLTWKAASIVGLRKGDLAVGADADVVIFDPNQAWTVQASAFQSKSKNSPFDGMKVKGRVKTTIVSGKIVYTM
ncbi:MAG TPA: dihydroorotase [Deltaproteobacteria bacterium]|nr:dihydroorotase [Deltaproteobacteria bacterium]